MALVLIGFALIILIDLIPIFQRRSGRTAIAFLLLFIPALTIAILQTSGVEVPSVLMLIENIVRAMGLNYN